MKIPTFFLALLVSSPSVVGADLSFDHLQIDKKSCALVHSGSGNKAVVWSGEKEFSMCFIKVDVNRFSQKYAYCALSGVVGAKAGSVMCQFGYWDAGKQRVFFMGAGDSLCEFVCIKQAK